MSSKNAIIILICFLNGFTVLSFELIYPKIINIWFGHLTSVWVVNLLMVLLSFMCGYFFSVKIIQREKPLGVVLKLLIFSFIYILGLSFSYKYLLDLLMNVPMLPGIFIFGVVMVFPLVTALSVITPIVIHELSNAIAYAASKMFFLSTIAGVFGVLFLGLYFIPYQGVFKTFMLVEVIIGLNALLTFIIGRSSEQQVGLQ